MRFPRRWSPWLALLCAVLTGFATSRVRAAEEVPGRWPAERANSWLEARGWLRGCNFIPSTAVNQLEMWQADTFDEATIDRELGFAENLGFNSVRVFLHDLLYQQDAPGFLARVDRFLTLADKHHIGVMFVLFDSCWHPLPKLGKQPAPIPFTHNSQWVQSPGAAALADPAQYPRLRAYAAGVVKRFADDRRVHAWDVWNEPGYGDDGQVQRPGLDLERGKRMEILTALLPQAFAWAREGKPSQPLTSPLWFRPQEWGSDEGLQPVERVQLENSDVISFHCYDGPGRERDYVERLRRLGRPLLCTEYLARPSSVFEPQLGYYQEQKVAAYNWGLVSGKTQTIYSWDSWYRKYTAEPSPWFHDILRMDGTPYNAEEAAYLRKVTGKSLE